jgi:hypothetical protein
MAAPTYSLTPQERTFYKTLYDSIHGKPSGIPADAVVSLFAKATPNLSTSVLGEIWNLADYQSSGTLTPQGFDIACRLVGHAQAGQTASQDLINKGVSWQWFLTAAHSELAQSGRCRNSKASLSPVWPSLRLSRDQRPASIPASPMLA